MKVITIPDLHGSTAWEKIDLSKYDLLIFVGDFCDHWTRTNEQILNNLKKIIQLKKDNPEKVVLLWGNHDLAYLYPSNAKYECSRFRPTIANALQILLQDNFELFQAAHQISNYLWTHAGMTKEFHDTVYTPIRNKMLEKFPEMSDYNTGDMLNAIFKTSYGINLAQVGYLRDGNYPCGGIFWADRKEHEKAEDRIPLHQITGHNRVDYPYTIPFVVKEGSVTFTDCLDNCDRFYEVEV